MQDMKVDERSAKQSLQALSKELKVQDEAVTAFREVTRSILKGSFHAKCVTYEPACFVQKMIAVCWFLPPGSEH